MKVEFDEPRCDGFGYCEEVAPEVFRVGDDGNLEVLVTEVPAQLEDKVLAATRACPVAALKVSR